MTLACWPFADLAHAAREAVLKQITVPHSYYFREMYLPQVASGPTGASWSPDGSELVYSMAGSLWQQGLESRTARQLTDGPGYDFQPDWSPDGSHVVFTRQHRDALELQLLDLASGTVTALTSAGAANVEPRFSPDGKRLAWVSTEGTGRFRVFVAELQADALRNARALLPERKSPIARYYYGAYDHELSPSWSPDGRSLSFVSNRDVPHGSGALWRAAIADPASAVRVHDEETNWQMRPDWSPDGSTLAYSSYLGRNTHQIWLLPAAGGNPMPLTYGEFDLTAVRWSRDGRRLAYVSNETGNTALGWIDLGAGGRHERLAIESRRYKRATGTLALDLRDAQGKPVAARVAVTGADARAHAPDDAWRHADDGFDRALQAEENRYFHAQGSVRLTVPVGTTRVRVWRGLESAVVDRDVEVSADRVATATIALAPLATPAAFGRFVGGDLHVHMNYGGHYRNTPARLVDQARAEDLDLVYNLVVNKEQRIPDIGAFRTDPDPASAADVLLLHGQEYHSSYWGHMGLLNLRSHYIQPDYTVYPNTAVASPVPTNGTVADWTHAQSGLVGYVHPFDEVPDPGRKTGHLSHALPVDVVLGKVDYYEVVGFADARATADIWYRLLNLGYRLPAGSGSDTMANYASLRGPVGMNRVYVDSGGVLERDAFLGALKAGRTMVTNGPLIGLTVAGQAPGDALELPANGRAEVEVWLRSIVPVDHLELVQNGTVLKRYALKGKRDRFDARETLKLDPNGWLLLRAWSEQSHPLVFDLYPYASTSPVYLKAPACRADAARYFLDWTAQTRSRAEEHPAYRSAAERSATLAEIDAARTILEKRCL